MHEYFTNGCIYLNASPALVHRRDIKMSILAVSDMNSSSIKGQYTVQQCLVQGIYELTSG